MSLADLLAIALGPVITGLSGDLGCRIAIYRPTLSETADGSTARVYSTADPTWSNAAGFFEPGRVGNPDGMEAIARPFGVRSTAIGTLTFVRSASGALPSITPFDGFKILTGPYTGYRWLAEAAEVTDGIGLTADVHVIAAPPTETF